MKLKAMIERPPDVEIPKVACFCKGLASIESVAQVSHKICLSRNSVRPVCLKRFDRDRTFCCYLVVPKRLAEDALGSHQVKACYPNNGESAT